MSNPERFAVPGAVEPGRDSHGLPEIRLRHASGAEARILEYGAQAVSWKDAAGRERFFMSREARFEKGKPVRGGIPVVFPQFCDNGPLPMHGFARIHDWAFVDAGITGAGGVFATFELRDSAATRAIWKHEFATRLQFVLDSGFAVEWTVANTGAGPFSFHNALHTYFLIADIRRTSVRGLGGAYSPRGGARTAGPGGEIRFDCETDRVYEGAPDALSLLDEAANSRLLIAKQGMADVVVWNPWIDKARRMEDFGDDEFERMVCVETGNIGEAIELEPGRAWAGLTRYGISDL